MLRPDLRVAIASLCLAVLLGCGGGSTSTAADHPPATTGARDDGGVAGDAAADRADDAGRESGTARVDDASVPPGERPNPCSACAPGELCVQLDDGALQCRSPVPTVQCRKLSAACAASLQPGRKDCQGVTDACARELCPSPYQCRMSAPCGNETAAAAVWCYGP